MNHGGEGKGAIHHRGTEAQRGTKEYLNELSGRVIGLCMDIHKQVGPGLLESAYEECLAYELSINGIPFERQVAMPVAYKQVKLDCGYRVDLVIDDCLIVELKSVAELTSVFEAQLLTYLKLSNKPIGLLVNFNVPVLKQGIRRIVLGDLFYSKPKRTYMTQIVGGDV